MRFGRILLVAVAACTPSSRLVVANADRPATHPAVEAPPIEHRWEGSPESGSGDPGEEDADAERSDGSPECAGMPACWTETRWNADGGGTLAIIRRPIVHESRCRPTEVWFTRDKHRQKLLSFCNDGYGASGVGADTLVLIGNELTYQRYGGSSWRWDAATTFSLVPFAAKKTLRAGYYMNIRTSVERWDWTTLGGSVLSQRDVHGDTPTWTLRIPSVSVPSTFEEEGWKHLHWKCGAHGGLEAHEPDPQPAQDEDTSVNDGVLESASRGPLVVFRSTNGTLFIAVRDTDEHDKPQLEIDEVEHQRVRRRWTNNYSTSQEVKSVYILREWHIRFELPTDVAGIGIRVATKRGVWRSGSLVNGAVTGQPWVDAHYARCVERGGALVAVTASCPGVVEGCD